MDPRGHMKTGFHFFWPIGGAIATIQTAKSWLFPNHLSDFNENFCVLASRASAQALQISSQYTHRWRYSDPFKKRMHDLQKLPEGFSWNLYVIFLLSECFLNILVNHVFSVLWTLEDTKKWFTFFFFAVTIFYHHRKTWQWVEIFSFFLFFCQHHFSRSGRPIYTKISPGVYGVL